MTLNALKASSPSDEMRNELTRVLLGCHTPLVGSSRNRIDGLVTSSQAIETRRFSPPEIDRLPEDTSI